MFKDLWSQMPWPLRIFWLVSSAASVVAAGFALVVLFKLATKV